MVWLGFFPPLLCRDQESNSPQLRCTSLRDLNSSCLTDWATAATSSYHLLELTLEYLTDISNGGCPSENWLANVPGSASNSLKVTRPTSESLNVAKRSRRESTENQTHSGRSRISSESLTSVSGFESQLEKVVEWARDRRYFRRKNYRCCWGKSTALFRGKWTVAWKYWSDPSSSG